jgi:hypothetical protein
LAERSAILRRSSSSLCCVGLQVSVRCLLSERDLIWNSLHRVYKVNAQNRGNICPFSRFILKPRNGCR